MLSWPRVPACVALSASFFVASEIWSRPPATYPSPDPTQSFFSIDAVQGVAVDERHVYALSGRNVSRHDKWSGMALTRSAPPKGDAGIVHLNGGVIHDGRLFAAHSDWPALPTRSSVEVWNTETLERVRTHSFGTRRGAFTWLDRHAGYWWGAFTDYGQLAREHPLEQTVRDFAGTQLVKMSDDFAILRTWTYPIALLQRFAPMSNSGGSWGPDSRLYLTGHDRGEAYIVTLPPTAHEIVWVETVDLPKIEGQGIAWDRSVEPSVLYGVNRSRRQIVIAQ